MNFFAVGGIAVLSVCASSNSSEAEYKHLSRSALGSWPGNTGRRSAALFGVRPELCTGHAGVAMGTYGLEGNGDGGTERHGACIVSFGVLTVPAAMSGAVHAFMCTGSNAVRTLCMTRST